MIFSIRDLSFELGSMLLEGWPAFAARAVCALLILLAAWLVRRWLTRKGFPALEARSWHFTGTPILLRSFAVPVQRMCTVVGIYLAASSLPWAIPGVRKLFLMAFQLVMTLLVCEGLYAASELADLVLASCSPEIRSNKTLLSLLNTTYKVLVIAVGVAAGAQEVGFPIGSIVAGAGLIGLTISLAAQESASNLFSGIVILLDKPFSVGDWITVGDVEGEVIDINFRSTRIRSPDKTVNVITNSKICSATVQNAALRTMRPYKFTLGVTYSTTRSQLEKLMQDLQAMLDASPFTNHGTNIVQLASFGDSSINILISAYLLTNVYAEFLQMQNDLNLNIMDIMQADGGPFRDVLQPDAQAQRQRTAHGIRFPAQGQRRRKAHHHAFRQVVQCYRQHHAALAPLQKLPGHAFQPQQSCCPQHQPCRGRHPRRDAQFPGALNGRQQQAPHAGRQHDARRHPAEHPLGARCRRPTQQEHPGRPQCGAHRREQQHPGRKNDLVQNAFPLCPFYVPAAQKVNAQQKSLQVSPQALLHATTTKRGLRMSERDVLFPVLCGFGPKRHLHFFSGKQHDKSSQNCHLH